MSYRTLTTKPLNASLKTLLKRGGHIGLGLSAFTPVLALANPTGGHVVSGQATIANPSANGTIITQRSNSAIINWQQFNIGAGQFVQFLQPSSSSVVLNRVIGNSSSSILGSLTANGQVFLVNTNGVYFGKGSSIDTQGFLASTLGITDQNFLAHNYVFNQPGAANATVINDGSITSHHGGYVVLAGDYAENDGLISAQSGHVVLASGSKATLALNGNNLVNFAVNQSTLAKYAGVKNTGSILADGGTVIMTADVANLLKSTVVNNTGLVEAHAISKDGGVIQLLASGGNIQNAGTLDASATRKGQAGGDITLKGDGVTKLTTTSNIDATGDGATGGDLEVSGKTIAVRGIQILGRGGNLLLDPDSFTIAKGSTGPGTGATHGGSGFGTGVDFIGTGFIDKKLNDGVTVTLDANKNITKGSGTAITATGTGTLKLTIGHGGTINLSGLTINIAGELSASVYNAASSGTHNTHMSFGRITAKSVDIVAGSNGYVQFAPATGTGTRLKPSVTATAGDIKVIANGIYAGSNGSLNLQATGNIFMLGEILNTGNVTMHAGGTIGAEEIVSRKDITLSAKKYRTNSGSLDFSASSNLTVDGAIGSSGSAIDASVTLKAGKTITLDHGIYNTDTDPGRHDISVTAGHLVYTGTGTFCLSAGFGNLTLDASIGSAAAPVKYAVNLMDNGYGAFLERSIFTNAGITVSQSGSHESFISAGDHPNVLGAGIDVGNTDHTAITLSAKSAISITGNSVKIGGGAPIVISADDGKSSTDTDMLSIVGIASHGTGVHIGGSSVASNAGSAHKVSVDHSVTLHAGQDVDIAGYGVFLEPGEASTSVHSAGVAATVTTAITVTAGDDIKFDAGDLIIGEGKATAIVQNDSAPGATAAADASVTLSAGHDIIASASYVIIAAGVAAVRAVATNAKQSATAVADTGVTIKAGDDFTVSAGSVQVNGGNSAGGGALVEALQSGGKAAASADANVAITATAGEIAIDASHISVQGGNGAGGDLRSSNHISCGGHCDLSITTYQQTKVLAPGKKAIATLTATANVSFTAGAGGISLVDENGLSMAGGSEVGAGVSVSAGGSLAGGKATEDAEAKVSLSTSGSIKLKGALVSVRGGANAAGELFHTTIGTLSGGSFHSSSFSHRANVNSKKGSSVKLTADGSVSLNAGTNLTIADSATSLEVSAGDNAADGMQLFASSGGHATANINASVNLNTTHGNIAVANTRSDGYVRIAAGSYAGTSVEMRAIKGGAAGLDVDQGIHLAAHGDVDVTAGTHVQIVAAQKAGYKADVTASSGSSVAAPAATAAMTALADVNITAGGALNVTAGHYLSLSAAEDPAYEAALTAKGAGGTASLLADSGVHIVTGGAVSLQAASYMDLYGAESAGARGVVRGSAGGAAKLTALADLDITAGGAFTATVTHAPVPGTSSGGLYLQGAEAAGYSASVIGNKGAATAVTDGSVRIQAGGGITLVAIGDLELSASGYAANKAQVHATSGQASLSALGGVYLTAKGAITAAAGGSSFYLKAAADPAYEASITAKGTGAKVNVTADAGVTLTAGGDVSLQARDALSIEAADSAANGAHVTGSSHGVAAVTAGAAIKITAGGNFIASAGTNDVIISAGGRAGASAQVTADHGTATLSADDGAHITAKGNLSVKSGTYMYISGSDRAAYKAKVNATDGTATEIGLSDVDLTAGGSVSLIAGSDMKALTYSDTGFQASLSAKGNGAKAALTADGGVHIAAGSGIAIKAHKYLHLLSSSDGKDYYTGASADVIASSGGSAALTAKSNLSLSAGGAISLNAATGSLEMSPDYYAGYKAFVSAKGTHSKATESADGGVSLTAGGDITLTAHTSVLLSASESAGDLAIVTGSSGGAAKLTANDGINVKTGGNFTASAGINSVVVSAADRPGASAEVTANKGTATLSADTGVHITAASNINVKGGDGVYISPGDAAGYKTHVTATSGAASITALSNVSLQAGKAITLSGGIGGLSLSASADVGESAALSAKGAGAKAILTADGSLSVVAGGSVTLRSGKAIEVKGGSSAGEKAVLTASSGGAATETAGAAVDITAGGNFLASTAFSAATFNGGDAAGESAKLTAGHGTASLDVDAGVHITAAGSVTIKSQDALLLEGADDAGYAVTLNATAKGKVVEDASGAFTIDAGGPVSLTAGSNMDITASAYAGYDASLNAGGAGAQAILNADTGVHITTSKSISVKAGTYMYLEGYYYAGAEAEVRTTAGGTATETALASLTLDAGGSISAAAGSFMSMSASYWAGGDAIVKAVGKAAKSNLIADGGVHITAGGALTLTANKYMGIVGSREAGSGASVTGSSDGVAKMAALDNVTLVTGGAFTAQAGGTYLDISGGTDAAYRAKVTAKNGTATLTADAGVSITAAGDVAITAFKNLNIVGGSYGGAGSSAHGDAIRASASGSLAAASLVASGGIGMKGANISLVAGSSMFIHGGNKTGRYGQAITTAKAVATLNASDGVSIAATGNFSAKAGVELQVHTGASASSDNAEYTRAQAMTGTATVSASNSINVKAGGSLQLSAGAGMFVTGYDYNGYPAEASASSGGVATVNALSHISLTAAGTVNVDAGRGSLDIHGTYAGAYSAEALAKNKGVATLNVDGSVTVKGSTVTLTAGSDMKIYGQSIDGYNDLASANSAGVAAVNAKDGVTVTATAGAVTATAVNEISIYAATADGHYSKTKADGSLSKATATADNSVTFSGKTISLAGSSMSIHGGNDAGQSTSVSAKDRGKATQTDDATVNFTAANGFSARLTGAGSGHDLNIVGGNYVGYLDEVHGSSAGVATLNVNGSVNIKVTAAGGTISIKTGSQLKSELSMNAGGEAGYNASAQANTGGTATLTANNSLNLQALGGIAIAASHGSVAISGGFSYEGYRSKAYAAGAKSKATLDDASSLNISGGDVSLLAGDELELKGGYQYDGNSASADAASGGAAAVTVDARANITAAGNISANAGSYMGLFAGESYNAKLAKAVAKHASGKVAATASLVTMTDLDLKAGGNISLKGGSELSIFGANGLASAASAIGSDHGVATLTATANVNITVGGTFTAVAAGDENIYGGSEAGRAAKVNGTGAGGVASLTAQTNVNIKAKTVTLTAGSSDDDSLSVYDKGFTGLLANLDATTGGTATVVAQSQVSISATGALTATAGADIEFSAGNYAASFAVVDGVTGVAKLTTNSNVTVSAGGAMTLKLQGYELSIDGGADGGRHAALLGSGTGGKAILTDTQTVSLTAGGAFKVTGAGSINIVAGGFAATSIDAALTDAVGGAATASVNSGISIKGSSLSVSHTGTLTKTSATGLNSGGLTEKGVLSILGGHISSFAPLGFSGTRPVVAEMLWMAPSEMQTSFGNTQTLGGTDLNAASALQPVNWSGSATSQLLPASEPAPLTTLQGDALVISLQPVLSVPSDPAGVWQWTHSDAATLFQFGETPVTAGGAGCVAWLLQDDGSRCLMDY